MGHVVASLKKRREIRALHRYFFWADRMRVHAEAVLSGSSAPEALFAHPYFSYWYGGMFVVIEGWKRLRLSDPEIDRLLVQHRLLGHLERHRHGAFHYHPKYFDAKLLGFVTEPGSAAWIRSVRDAFSRWFLDWIGRDNESTERTGRR